MFNLIGKIILNAYTYLINIMLCIKDILLYILCKLDCDTRTNVYIGITGILVAIVIFIAEIISDKKVEIYKKLMLEKTNIVKNVKTMIIIMGVIWIGNIFEEKCIEGPYIIAQLIINILVIYSMIQTFKTFIEVIKLNTDKEYFNKQLKDYIYSKVKINVKEKEKNETFFKRKNQELLDFISNSQIIKFNNFPFKLRDKYKELKSNKDGYIESYNYDILNKIIENLQSQIKSNSNDYSTLDDKNDRKPEIYLCRKVGEKCTTSTVIAYCKNVENGLINLINKAIIVDTKKYKNYDDEISKILEDVFIIYNENSSNTELNNILIEFYDFICKNKYESIISLFMKKIYDMRRKYTNYKDENESFSLVLSGLSITSFKNKRYEEYRVINLYLVSLYVARMNYEGVDLKEIAYKYVNWVFLFNYYSLNIKKDYRYYDVIMASLLIIIKELFDRRDIDAIIVLLKNIYFEKNNYSVDKQFTEYDIVNFQFVIAIIYFILYVYKNQEKKEGIITENFIESISKLIDILKYKIFVFYDILDTILKFIKYSEKHSEITNVMETVDFNSDIHKYENSWITTSIDLNEVLKCLIYMFNITYLDFNTINEKDIDRKEKYKYERLLKVLESSTYVELEKKYKYEKMQKNIAITVLKKVIDIAEKKEIEYEKQAEIDCVKLESFKENLLKSIEEKSEIEKLIYQLGKIKNSDEKLKRTWGISQLIPRNWFIKHKDISIDNVTKDYGIAFKRGIEKEVIDYINKEGKEIENTLSEIVNNLNNLNDYILLANRRDLYNLKYKYGNNYVEIDDKKIRTIFVLEKGEFILIKKDALPFIELCMFDDSYSKENVKGYIYIELIDCSNNESLRKRIIDNNDWLQEKGNAKEQNDYLKTMCYLKIYKAYKIIESKNKEIYIIKDKLE